MKQSALTILTPIDPALAGELNDLLTKLGADVARQTTIPFAKLDLLHFASWVIIRSDTFGPQLVFESNFDGEPEAFLNQVITRAGAGLDQIYRSCPDYPRGGGTQAISRYLLEHAVYTDTFYIGCVGVSSQRIVSERNLREKIETFLDTFPVGDHDPFDIRRRIQEFVRSDEELQWAQQPPDTPSLYERIRFWAPPAIAIAVLLALLSGIWMASRWSGVLALIAVIAGIVLVLYFVLRRHERSDPSISDQPADTARSEDEHVQQLTQREDRRPQNHLASLTTVKPGPFRFTLLKTVLAVINLAARYIFNKGNLGGIPSIHFARWVIVNRGQHLLFLSNFDGSWEHYLGEFIDQAAEGLTAVWSNAVNFPRTCGLIKGGAADEQKFKAFARTSQVYTQLWYSAYPFLSVGNILNNAAIHEKLWGAMTNRSELDAWLRRF